MHRDHEEALLPNGFRRRGPKATTKLNLGFTLGSLEFVLQVATFLSRSEASPESANGIPLAFNLCPFSFKNLVSISLRKFSRGPLHGAFKIVPKLCSNFKKQNTVIIESPRDGESVSRESRDSTPSPKQKGRE